MRHRGGGALPLVLLTIALVSALGVGGLAVSRALAAGTRIAGRAMTVQGVVEGALTGVVASWDSLARAAQPVGVVIAAPPQVERGVQVAAWVTRIGDRTYWLVAEATLPGRPVLRRRLGLVIHTNGGAAAPVPARAWAQLP